MPITLEQIIGTAGAAISDPAGIVTSIVVETEYGPPIVVDQPLVSGNEPSPYGAFMKPMITVNFKPGTLNPWVIAPYGKPTSHWQAVKIAGVVGGAAMLYFLVMGILGK